MFGWFRPTCPIDDHARRWIDRRLGWLADQFGLDVFTRRAVTVPDAEFFPDRYDGSEECVRELFDQVCRYMDVEPGRVQLEFFTTRGHPELVNKQGQWVPTAAGLYGGDVIRLNRTEFHDPTLIVGTSAHELAHLRLMGEDRVSGRTFDNELLTDLTVVFHGLGIFLANSPRAHASQFSTWPKTDVMRPEYMTQPMFGYALAMQAWMRWEKKPAWASHLNMDARCSFRQALKYLWAQDAPDGPARRDR